MLKYILKRILIFIPTLIIISLVTFVISINAPGDPVEGMLNQNSGDGQSSQKIAAEKAYVELRHQLGFDLPLFYFSFTNATYPDTLYKIPKIARREVLQRMAFEYGNWEYISHYYIMLVNLETALYELPLNESNSAEIGKVKDYITTLYDNYDDQRISMIFSNLDFSFSNTSALMSIIGSYNSAKTAYHDVVHNKKVSKKYIPKLVWYGTNNQYHSWMFGDKPWYSSLPWVDDSGVQYRSKGFMRGDFGISYQDKRPVSSVINDAIGWTIKLSLISILIAYLIAVPLGVKSAVNKGSKTERGITTTLFMLYSLPSFWIGTIVIIFFCGGDWFAWFPPPGAPPIPDDAPFMYKLTEGAYRMVLPVFCLSYSSLAFISRQMRGGMLNVIGQDYIRTARAKGLEEKKVIWKHALRNSLIPIITLFASVFPASIAGSFVIEYIFSIPGMGKVSFEALSARNYPIIYTTLMFTAILTLIGNLIADTLYAIADPRISFNNKK